MNLGRFELCLNVADLEEARRFYLNLGFDVVGGEVSEKWLKLQVPTLTLVLYQDHIHDNVLNFRGNDIFALAGALAQKGVSFDKPAAVESDGSVGAWLRDPDGNLIYLNTLPGEAAEA